jgi:hypothetical protein
MIESSRDRKFFSITEKLRGDSGSLFGTPHAFEPVGRRTRTVNVRPGRIQLKVRAEGRNGSL